MYINTLERALRFLSMPYRGVENMPSPLIPDRTSKLDILCFKDNQVDYPCEDLGHFKDDVSGEQTLWFSSMD